MLTKRSLLLTIPGLFMGLVAAAQSPAAATAPTPSFLLSLVAGSVGAVVLIFGLMTAGSLATAAAEAAQTDAVQPVPAAPATAQTEAPEPVAAPAPAEVAVEARQLVAA